MAGSGERGTLAPLFCWVCARIPLGWGRFAPNHADRPSVVPPPLSAVGAARTRTPGARLARVPPSCVCVARRVCCELPRRRRARPGRRLAARRAEPGLWLLRRAPDAPRRPRELGLRAPRAPLRPPPPAGPRRRRGARGRGTHRAAPAWGRSSEGQVPGVGEFGQVARRNESVVAGSQLRAAVWI